MTPTNRTKRIEDAKQLVRSAQNQQLNELRTRLQPRPGAVATSEATRMPGRIAVRPTLADELYALRNGCPRQRGIR